MDGKESQCPIVALKLGNGPPDPVSEGGAALWMASWNHAEDTAPHQRVTAKRAGRARDSDTPQRDEPSAFNVHARICGSPREQSLGRPGRFHSRVPVSFPAQASKTTNRVPVSFLASRFHSLFAVRIKKAGGLTLAM